MREPAPPYVGEGPHALWHVSENAAIERFEPHVSATAASSEPRVWAVDSRHLPLYWFPRECPRGTFWATSQHDPAGRRAPGRREPGAPRRDELAGAHAQRPRRRIPIARGDVHARRRGRRLLAQPSCRRARRRRASSVTSSHDTRRPGSSCARCRTCGRSGIASPRRRSSSAGYAFTTRCRSRT